MSVVTLTESCPCGARIAATGGSVFVEGQARLFREAHADCRDRLTTAYDLDHWFSRLPMEGEEE